jgi:CRISPR-associated protein Cas1
MSYSDEALRLRSPSPGALPRLEDRVTFLYLDYCRILQTSTGVAGIFEPEGGPPEELEVPAGSLAVLLLGPGTSITNPAVGTLARAGCTVVFTGTDGMVTYGMATPLTASGEWAQAQARMWADPHSRLSAARWLYEKRFPGVDFPEDMKLQALRGLEGHRVKLAYQQMAAEHHLKRFRRITVGASDPVNVSLNIGNAVLYGCAAAVCSALSLNPALGVIHHGDAGAFLFDLADLYKLRTSVPAAFAAATAPDPIRQTRRHLREHFRDQKMLKDMMNTVLELLSPHRQAASGDQLLSDDGFVPGAHNYADES